MKEWEELENLILVPGHAIPHAFGLLNDDGSWFLKPFQSGEGRCLVEHVQAGVRLAAADPKALLIFAGGQSDAAAGPHSEAQGYWLIAEQLQWENAPSVRNRATTEEFSSDSFLNLLFGICRFRECTGRYPSRLSVAGWKFKEARFEFHRETLDFPASRYSYVGVNNPDGIVEAEASERECLEEFRRDPYGMAGTLAAKRAARNPFLRRHGYEQNCPEFADLLQSLTRRS